MSTAKQWVWAPALALVAAACVENPDGKRLDEMRERLRREMARSYQRPTLGAPERGRAFDEYKRAIDLAQEHTAPYANDGDWPAIDDWRERDWRPPLPGGFEELRQRGIDVRVAESLRRGARRTEGAAPNRLQVDSDSSPFSSIARDLVAMSVHQAIAEGWTEQAVDRALALLWFGFDCERGEGIVGSAYSWYYADAANRLLRAIEDALDPAERRRAARLLQVALDSEVDPVATIDAEVLFGAGIVVSKVSEDGYGDGWIDSDTIDMVYRQMVLWDRIRGEELSADAKLIALDLLREQGIGNLALRVRKRNAKVRSELQELQRAWEQDVR